MSTIKNGYGKKVYNVGIYLRLSNEDEYRQESDSIANQRDLLTKYVIEHGWNLIDYYVDDGYTGTNFERPSFLRMKEDIENGRINLIITKDLSRLGRDYIETGYYLERYFIEKGVRYIALNDNIDTSIKDHNADMIPFRAVMNDMYAKDISKKVRSVIDDKRGTGKFIGAHAPYGYKKDGQNRNQLIIDQEAAAIVKRIYHMYISGHGYTAIARALNNDKISSPSAYKSKNMNYHSGRAKIYKWTAETIRNILKNPTYKGCLAQNKNIKLSYKVKRRVAVPREEWVIVEDTHIPIVDNQIFEAVQLLMKKKTHQDYTKKSKHLLIGLVYCGDCGSRMTYARTSKGECYCICSRYKRIKSCSRHSIKESELDQLVLQDLKTISYKFLNEEELMKQEIQTTYQIKLKEIEKEIQRIQRSLEEVRTTIKSLYVDKVKGIISEKAFLELSGQLNQDRESFSAQLKELGNKKKTLSDMKRENQILSSIIEDLKNCENLSSDELAGLIDKVEIYETNQVRIHYRFQNPF